MKDSEIVFTCAFPAAGKTSLIEKYAGYERLNRDTIGGTLAEIAAELDKRLSKKPGKFVLDNTYATKAYRKDLVDVAKKHKVPIRCIWLDTSIEDAQVNACHRMVRKHGKLLMPDEISAASVKDSNTFNITVLFAFRKAFQEPEESEGFKLEIVKFVRKPNPEYNGKAILLDYDGTLRITKSGDNFPTSPDDVSILPGRTLRLKKCLADGYRLLGVSNQSGIAKGELTMETARACFEQTNKLLGVDIDVMFCPHRIPPFSCYCRKPAPGLGVHFIEKYKLDPAKCIMVGDMGSDETFAERCGFQFEDQAEFFA